MKNFLLCVFFVQAVLLTMPLQGEEKDIPDKAAEYFFYRCAGCHTVGGGKLSGPDLVTSAKWSSGDLKAAIKLMEKNVGPLSSADIDQMIEFLKDLDVSNRIARQKQKIEAKFRAELPPASYETGEHLFKGQKVLLNGGPACIACHQFSKEGGALGPDLSLIKDRLSGIALQSAVENSSYKIMRSIYEKKKITKEEALHIAEYLSHPERSKPRFAPNAGNVGGLAGGGLGSFFVLLWVWNRQKKRHAKENLVQRNSREGRHA